MVEQDLTRLMQSQSTTSDTGISDLESNDNFKVVIRVRPPVERELEGGKQFQNIVTVDAEAKVLTLSENIAAMSAAERAGTSGEVFLLGTFLKRSMTTAQNRCLLEYHSLLGAQDFYSTKTCALERTTVSCFQKQTAAVLEVPTRA